jgi:dienelactone hydrolase
MTRTIRLFALTAMACTAFATAGIARADNITIPASGGSPEITGYLAKPSGPGPFPAVLVLHGCEGFGSLETSEVNELASIGYVALAIDMLKPQGMSNACSQVSEATRNAVGYAMAALGWLHGQSYVVPEKLGVVGFSMGGIVTLSLVDPRTPHPPIPGLQAAVAYYPNCSDRSTNVATPLLILNGSADDWIPPQGCQQFVQAAQAAGKTVQITTYPGATHAFNQPSNRTRMVNGHTLTYDPQAASDADAKMRAFFAQYFR